MIPGKCDEHGQHRQAVVPQGGSLSPPYGTSPALQHKKSKLQVYNHAPLGFHRVADAEKQAMKYAILDKLTPA